MSEHALPVADQPVVYVIHDNPEWIPPFAEAFEQEGVAYVEWQLPQTVLDLSSPPPPGIFWSRLSASSHTRTDPHVKDYGRAVLAWLDQAGATVVNGADVYEFEVSKVRQHRALEDAGFSAPKTVASLGSVGIASAAKRFNPPFITKHNQGGKGLGVRRFDSQEELQAAAPEFAPGGENAPIDGITLLQEYIQPAEPFITRAEFIGGRFLYAVKVDISAGSFELCPADACEVPQEGIAEAVCAVPGEDTESAPSPTAQFTRRDEITVETPLIPRLEQFLADQRIDIAGIEFIETAEGDQVVYDVNTNTNYNPGVELSETQNGRVPAARALVRYLKTVLQNATASSL